MHAVAQSPSPRAESGFYASTSMSFGGLGLSEALVTALKSAGYEQPAHVQALSIPRVLAGSDVILAAETGSGKTLAYLVPVIDSLLRRKQMLAEERPHAPEWFHHCAVVLCPNVELCEQVVRVAATLCAGDGTPLANTAIVSAKSPPGPKPVDVIVSTPAALMTLLTEFGDAYGKAWTPQNLAQRVRHFVADEADALVTSQSYWDPLSKLLDLMRAADRAFAARAMASVASISVAEFEELKRGFKMGAYADGLAGMLAAGWQPAAEVTEDMCRANEQLVPRDITVGAPHRCRSYMFVAATMPSEGGKSVAADLRKRYPRMEWLQGTQLHFSKAAVSHRWLPLGGPQDVASTVVTVLREDEGLRSGIGHVAVFCRDVKSATALHQVIDAVGIKVLLYHKKLPPPARRAALETLRTDEGWTLVCTDAAARGLDVPNIHHVIQADFADNAVEFLHRIGRTARAGRPGLVTNCYTPDRLDLVEAIKMSIEEDAPVEGAFSRNRSFSTKMKRRGRYIPRGKGEDYVKTT